MMTLVSCKEYDKANQLLERMKQEALNSQTDPIKDETLSKSAGERIGQAILQWNNHQYDLATNTLWDARYQLQAVGGSIAQRDIFEIMMIKSALKSKMFTKANALLSERIQHKPGSPSTWKWYSTLLSDQNATEKAKVAMSHYHRLVSK
jgi:hypothetical protein